MDRTARTIFSTPCGMAIRLVHFLIIALANDCVCLFQLSHAILLRSLDPLVRSEMETMVSPPKKGVVPKIFGGVMKYIMWWIKTSAWLGGASEAKEYGTMTKTDN